MKQARAYSSALDQRDEQERLAQQARMRNQTIQSMQTKKYELDERKLGVSQPKTQYVSALPILNTVDSVVNPALKQNTPAVQGLKKAVQQYAPAPTLANMGVNNDLLNQSNPLHSRYQSAMPNASLVQQATNNFQQWNTQYEQDEDRYIDDLDRVTTLIGLGAPNEDADKQLAESEEKLNQTKAQWNSMMRQTLDMLGPGVENLIRSVIKDAKDKRPTTSPEKYQRMLQARELRKLLGNDLYGELAEYVRQQENSIRMSKKKEEAAKFANENGVGASAVSIPKKLIGGVSGVFDTYAQTFDRIFSGSHAPLDWNTELQVPNREASTIRSTVAQNIAEDTGSTKVLPGLYNFGMGMLDSVAAMPINVVTGGWGTALMASAAANDTMQNVKARGGSDDQALTLGTVTLIAEILTEKMSFDDLDALDVSDMTKFKETLWNNVKSQGKSEGMEEGIAESIEAIADAVIMGDKSELRQSMREYEARGYNRDQALAMAIGGAAGNIMLSSAGGAVSGGLFAAGKTTGAWALNKIRGNSQNVNADVDDNSPFQAQVQQDVQQNQAEHATVNPIEVQRTQQNAQTAQDQLNGPILAAMNELSGQQTNQNADVQQPGKVPAPGVEAEVDKQPARGVGAAESGYSGDIGTWKRDASEFIKDTELPKQDKSGDTISDSAGSMFKSNVPKETKETIEHYAYEGEYSYEKDANKAQIERVHKAIEQDGFDAVYERTVQQLTDHRASADTTAQAWVLFIQAANRGDSAKAATLSKLIQRYSTSVAQAMQANSIYNKLTPEGRLASIQRTVNRINQDIETQRGKSGSKVGLDGVAEVSVGDGQTVETASQAAINDAYETSLDLIRNIYKAFSENRNGEKLDFDQWMHKIGETLAKSIKGRTQGKNNMTVSRMIEQDILRFAKDYLPEAAKRKGRTAIDTLTQYYEHKDWYHEAWETAQDVLAEGSGRKLDNLAVDQTPVMERAIIEAAADQELSKKDIRLRDYLGSRNALASQISAELINQTGATGTDADNIKSACLRYIVEVSEGEGSERKTRNGGTINKAEAQVQADTNKLLKEAGTDIYKILKQHPSDREAVANEIADKLVLKYGLDEKAAQKASQKIVEQFNKMVADKSKTAIEKVIKDSKKEPTPKQRRTLTQALREAANSGMFSQKDSAAIVTRKLFGQEVQIDSALMQEYLSAKGEDQIQAVEDKIYKNIASQMPASLGEKARAWRYMGMLANPKTHINNFSGNVTMYGERKAKDTIKAGLEALFLPQDQRTAAVLPGKERRAAAAADYENVKSMILDGDKYSDSADSKIQENRRIFSNSILEGIRVKNDELLNAFGDGIFAKANYTDALAGILKARGYTAEDFTNGNIPEAQLDSMRAYAIKEAQKATFRDLNSFSRFVRDIGFKNTEGNAFKKGANVAVEGVLAFKKTPANVLARGAEYSPAGLLDALTRGSKQLANGDITASQYLDRVSSGLTGSALMGFGYLLSKLGLLKGGTGDDDEQDKLEGRQNFAIEIGGKSYTLTFLSPASMPLFMGAQLEQILDGGAGDGPMMDKVLNVFKGISDPILEMSMMSGLQDALESTDYADNKILAFVANAGLSYLTQYMPTLGGQIKRTFQKPQRTTTFVNEADPVLNKDAQRAIGTATNKIPGPSYQQIPYIDAWGRRQDQGNLATRAFNNLVNPMYVSELKQTDVDREIRRLEKQTGKNYTPSRADNVLTIDGETVILTADEYVTYAESKGQNDFEMRSNLIASSTYKTLDDYTKGKAMEASKDYANNLAEKEIGLNPPTPPWMEELEGKTAEEVTDALIVHVLAAQAGNSENKYNAYADQISSGVPAETVLMALTDPQQENYSKYIQKAKVPAETYLDVLSFESKCVSDKDKKGNVIAGSKKEKVVAYIDGLKLTRKQKRALYLCFYSEKDDTFK
jgi:hypothetical protein